MSSDDDENRIDSPGDWLRLLAIALLLLFAGWVLVSPDVSLSASEWEDVITGIGNLSEGV